MDRLQQSELLGKELSGQVFLSTVQAFRCLAEQAPRAG